MLEIGYRILKVSEITIAAKAILECSAEVVEVCWHACMVIWSKLDDMLEIGYRIFEVSEVTSAAKARFECAAKNGQASREVIVIASRRAEALL